jgi:hypothetical protein
MSRLHILIQDLLEMATCLNGLLHLMRFSTHRKLTGKIKVHTFSRSKESDRNDGVFEAANSWVKVRHTRQDF